MVVLHDPTVKMFVVEGWVEPEEFLAEMRGYGILPERQWVSYGYAIKESAYKYRILKKGRDEYGPLDDEPIEVMYYRY